MLGLSDIGIFNAFGAGVVSFLSPCILPLVPGYVSYVADHAGYVGRRAVWLSRVCRLSG
jgi:cytochrome c-type biogenesis protein